VIDILGKGSIIGFNAVVKPYQSAYRLKVLSKRASIIIIDRKVLTLEASCDKNLRKSVDSYRELL